MYLLLGQTELIFVLNKAVMGGDVIECVEEAGLRVCISWGQCQDIYKAIGKFYPSAVFYYFCVNFK